MKPRAIPPDFGGNTIWAYVQPRWIWRLRVRLAIRKWEAKIARISQDDWRRGGG